MLICDLTMWRTAGVLAAVGAEHPPGQVRAIRRKRLRLPHGTAAPPFLRQQTTPRSSEN